MDFLPFSVEGDQDFSSHSEDRPPSVGSDNDLDDHSEDGSDNSSENDSDGDRDPNSDYHDDSPEKPVERGTNSTQ